MKYLIIFFLTINMSYAAKCGPGNIADVNKCEVNDLITNFVDYETCEWPEEAEILDMNFVNLICDPVVPLSFFETKLQEWKDINIVRITEELRIKDVKDRLIVIGIKFGKYDSIDGLRPFMIKCNYSHSNPAIWIREVFKIENVSMLVCMESKKAEVDQDKLDRETKDTEKKDKKTALKNYDCDLEAGYVKLLCELGK